MIVYRAFPPSLSHRRCSLQVRECTFLDRTRCRSRSRQNTLETFNAHDRKEESHFLQIQRDEHHSCAATVGRYHNSSQGTNHAYRPGTIVMINVRSVPKSHMIHALSRVHSSKPQTSTNHIGTQFALQLMSKPCSFQTTAATG